MFRLYALIFRSPLSVLVLINRFKFGPSSGMFNVIFSAKNLDYDGLPSAIL